MEDGNEQFECPGCKTLISEGTPSCPNCGMEFDWGARETEETLDELIEQVDEEKAGETPYDPSPGSGAVVTSTGEDEEVPDREPAQVPVEEERVPEEPVARRRTLSLLGMAFAALTVVSLIGLLVVLNYDTWIDGAEENSIGDTQIMYVYLAATAFVVCLLVVVFDLVRNRRAA